MKRFLFTMLLLITAATAFSQSVYTIEGDIIRIRKRVSGNTSVEVTGSLQTTLPIRPGSDTTSSKEGLVIVGGKLKLGNGFFYADVSDSLLFTTLLNAKTDTSKTKSDSATLKGLIDLKENVSNKVNVITSPNSTDYPTTQALSNFVYSLTNGKLSVYDTASMLLPYQNAINAKPTYGDVRSIVSDSMVKVVKYSDSVVKYVTPKNLKDSVNVYRGLITTETNRATAAEAFKLNISDSLSKYVTPQNLKDSGNIYRGIMSNYVLQSSLSSGAYFDTTRIRTNALSLDTTNSLIIKNGFEATYKKNNVAVGFRALDSSTTGNANVAIGKLALLTNKVGNQNVAIGIEAMRNNTASSFNTALGSYAMGLGKGGSSNTAVGYASLYNDSTLGNQNTAVGHYSLFSNIGGGSFMGSSNTSVGAFAMQNNKYSSANTAVGTLALRNIDNPSGGSNTAMGQGALQNARGGFSNTVIGTQAGFVASGYIQSLTLVGRDAGYDLTTGGNNVFLGFRTGRGITTGRGNTVLGVANYVFPSNLTRNVVIGCDDSTATDYTKNIYIWIDSNKNATFYGNVITPKVNITTGSNAAAGTATLSVGTVTVSTTAVTANSLIFLTVQETGTNNGRIRVSARSAGTSFTITSSDAGDNCVVAYEIRN